jgi:hypothetical protein
MAQTMERDGKVYVAESGGGYTRSGHAMVVAGERGERLRPSYLLIPGRAGGEHAWFRLTPGMLIVDAERRHGYTTVTVSRVTGWSQGTPVEVKSDLLGMFMIGLDEVPEEYRAAVAAAAAKAECYHCREAHYVLLNNG